MALDLNLEGAEGPEGVAGRKRVVGSVGGRPSRGRGTAGTGVLEGATVVAVAGNGAQSATQTVTCRPASAPNSASVHVASPSSAWGTRASPLPEPAPAHFLPLLFFFVLPFFLPGKPFPQKSCGWLHLRIRVFPRPLRSRHPHGTCPHPKLSRFLVDSLTVRWPLSPPKASHEGAGDRPRVSCSLLTPQHLEPRLARGRSPRSSA